MTATVIKKYEYGEFVMPKPITSDAENEQYTLVLLSLDRKGNLNPEEQAFAEILTSLIEAYEEKRYHVGDASPKEVLVELMKANNLKQKDLIDELGPASVISETLHGPRTLNVGQIDRLSKRFKVSPALFF